MRTALVVAVATSALTVGPATPAYAALCYAATSGGSTWYAGPSASYRYDLNFGNGPVAVPQPVLDAYVPQGLTTWMNWDGTGANLLVYSAYASNGTRSLVMGVNPVTGVRTRPAYVPYSHVGGIAVAGGYAWIAGGGKLSRYSLTALRGAFKGTATASIQPGYARDVYGSSFVTAYGTQLFSGRFNNSARDKMHGFRIEANGTLTLLPGSIEVPAKTQGAAVTGTHIVFSASYGETSRSTVYVVRRGYSLDSTRASCFAAPTMSEGVTIYNGRVYVLFESGANYYLAGSDPSNVIKRLHQVPLSKLTAMVG